MRTHPSLLTSQVVRRNIMNKHRAPAQGRFSSRSHQTTEHAMWMITTLTALVMIDMAAASIGGINYAEENGRDLLAAGAAVRQGKMSAGFLTRLKAKLENMV